MCHQRLLCQTYKYIYSVCANMSAQHYAVLNSAKQHLTLPSAFAPRNVVSCYNFFSPLHTLLFCFFTYTVFVSFSFHLLIMYFLNVFACKVVLWYLTLKHSYCHLLLLSSNEFLLYQQRLQKWVLHLSQTVLMMTVIF